MPSKIGITEEMAEHLKVGSGFAIEATIYTINEILPKLDTKQYFRHKMQLRGPFKSHVTVDLSKDGLDKALAKQVERLGQLGIKTTSFGLLRLGWSIFLKDVAGV